MAVEVASLLARITVSLEGARQAAEEARKLRDSISGIGGEADLQARRVGNLTDQMIVLADRLATARQKMQQAEEAIRSQGATIEEAANAQKNLTERLARARAELEAFQDKVNRTASDWDNYFRVISELRELESDREGGLKALAAAYDDLVAAQRQAITVEGRLITIQDRLRRETQRTIGSGDQQGMRGLVSQLKNINNGSLLSASGIISLVGRLTKLGAVIGGVLIVVFRLWRAFRQAFDLRAQISQLGQLSDDLAQLSLRADTARTQVLAFSKAVENSFRALGESRPEQATEAVVKLAEELRFLTVDRDLNRTVQLIREALRGNIQPLAEATGLSVQRLKDQIGDLTRITDENVAINRRWAAILSEVDRNQRRIDTAQQNSVTSFRDVKVAVANLWDSIARLLAPSFGDLLEQVKKFIELITPMARGIAQGLIPIFRLLQAALALVNLILEKVVETSAKAQRAIARFVRTISVGIRPLKQWADFLDAGATEIENLLKSMREGPGRIDDFTFSIDGAASSLEKARAAARQFLSDVRGGTGLISTIRQLGEASKALREGPDPATALSFATAYEQAFAQVFEGGVEKIKALQKFFDRQFAEGRLGEKEFEALQKVLDATVAAYEPLQKEVDDFFGATQNARTGLQGTTSAMQTATSAAYSLADGADAARKSLEGMSGTYTVDIVQRVSTIGGGFVGGGGGGLLGGVAAGLSNIIGGPVVGAARRLLGGGGGGGRRLPFVDETERLKARFGRTAPPTRPVSTDIADIYRERFEGVKREVERQKNLDEARRRAEDLAGLFPRRGGGGGGGGGPRGATLDEIREFIQQVNRAIIAGIRGGKVFSTAGNAIPLTEGAFINARGGALVENVTIRGVWDFADPAAKREIVRQLREALQQFSKEVA